MVYSNAHFLKEDTPCFEIYKAGITRQMMKYNCCKGIRLRWGETIEGKANLELQTKRNRGLLPPVILASYLKPNVYFSNV